MKKRYLPTLALTAIITLAGCDGLDLAQILPTEKPEIETVQISSFFNYRYNRRGKTSLATVLGASASDGGTTDPNILAPPLNARDFSRWMSGIDSETGQVFFLLNPEQEDREGQFTPSDFSVQVWTQSGVMDWISGSTTDLGEYKLTQDDIDEYKALMSKGAIFNIAVALEGESLEQVAFATADGDTFELASLEPLASDAISTCETGEGEEQSWDWSGAHDFTLVNADDLTRLNIAKTGIYCGLNAE